MGTVCHNKAAEKKSLSSVLPSLSNKPLSIFSPSLCSRRVYFNIIHVDQVVSPKLVQFRNNFLCNAFFKTAGARGMLYDNEPVQKTFAILFKPRLHCTLIRVNYMYALLNIAHYSKVFVYHTYLLIHAPLEQEITKSRWTRYQMINVKADLQNFRT